MELVAIKELIIDHICDRYDVLKEDLDENINIFEEGIVDSLGAFELVSYIESTFKVELGEENFFDTRFRCIHGMSEIVFENQSSPMGGAL